MSTHQDKKTGRFLPGNKASPGRKKKAIERDYTKMFTDVVTSEKWREVIEAALKLAIGGDSFARRWLSDYIIGKPPQILELRGAEAQQLAQLIEAMKQRGMSAGDLFGAMIAELAMSETELDDETQ